MSQKLDTTEAARSLIRAQLGNADPADAAELVYLANLIKGDGNVYGEQIVRDGIKFLKEKGDILRAINLEERWNKFNETGEA